MAINARCCDGLLGEVDYSESESPFFIALCLAAEPHYPYDFLHFVAISAMDGGMAPQLVGVDLGG